MRAIVIAIIAVVAVIAALFVTLGVMSESGEVVVLVATDAEGPHETRLWIVEDAGALWLRGGNPDSEWLARLRANPDVEVVREGKAVEYRAVLVDDQAARGRVNELMAEKYGLPDRVVGWMADRSLATPIRLDPRPPGE